MFDKISRSRQFAIAMFYVHRAQNFYVHGIVREFIFYANGIVSVNIFACFKQHAKMIRQDKKDNNVHRLQK